VSSFDLVGTDYSHHLIYGIFKSFDNKIWKANPRLLISFSLVKLQQKGSSHFMEF